MVIPVQTEPPLIGQTPPMVMKAMHTIRWCVLLMYAFIFFRISQGDALLAALSDLVPAIVGTYLLRDDPYFLSLHLRLQSVSQAGQGGMNCLPSFMVLSGLNGMLGLFRGAVLPVFHRSSVLLQSLIVSSALIEIVACGVCCWAWKAIHRSRPGLLDDAADVEYGNDDYAHSFSGPEALIRRAIELSRRDRHSLSSTRATAMPRVWQPAVLQEASEDDPALRLAIQASMQAESGSLPLMESEEDALLIQAVQQSQAAALAGGNAEPEVERVLRQAEAQEGRRIVQEQDAEFEESLAIDQIREEQEREKRAEASREEQRLREEEERRKAEEAERLQLEAQLAEQALKEAQAKRDRLPLEPEPGDTDRVTLLFRLPRGQKIKRSFRSTDCVGSLYDFVDTEDLEMAKTVYHLLTQPPRRVYKDREQTLEDAGVENQSVILVEVDD